jgi:Leucine Rich repeat
VVHLRRKERLVGVLLLRYPQLKELRLRGNRIGNEGLKNLMLALGDTYYNTSLTSSVLSSNDICGTEGARQLSLLLHRLLALKSLYIGCNPLGPLGASTLAPGINAATCQLERLCISNCGLGMDGVANLVPNGAVNTKLTYLDVWRNMGGENVLVLASRCTNLEFLGETLNQDQERRLTLLLDRKRLCTEAQALAGTDFSAMFRFVEKAHRHEHGLSAIFVMLQNDGEDRFYNANKRAGVLGTLEDVVQVSEAAAAAALPSSASSSSLSSQVHPPDGSSSATDSRLR